MRLMHLFSGGHQMQCRKSMNGGQGVSHHKAVAQTDRNEAEQVAYWILAQQVLGRKCSHR